MERISRQTDPFSESREAMPLPLRAQLPRYQRGTRAAMSSSTQSRGGGRGWPGGMKRS